MARRWISLALAGAALALLAAFALFLGVCGYKAVSAVSPGEAMGAPHCVGFVHPFVPGLLAGGALAFAAAWVGRRDTLLWLGGTIALLTLPVFSLGLAGTAAGLLMVAAGMATRRFAAGPGPSPMISLSLTGFVTVAGAFVLGPSSPDALVLAGVAIVSLGLAIAGRPILVALVGALAVLWGAFRYQQEALGDVLLSAFFLASGAAGLAALPKRETAPDGP